MSAGSKRQLAAILFADIQGYTALMQRDEQQASTLLRNFQKQMEEKVAAHNGRIANFYGDGALCIFQIPIEAVHCAMELQKIFNGAKKTPVRIGIHSGTVTVEGDKVFGDSVNITSRIESMSVPGAVLLSKKVRDDVKNNPDLKLQSLGRFEFKNVEEPVEVFALANKAFVVPRPGEMKGKLKSTDRPKGIWLIPALLALIMVIVGSLYYFNQNKPSAPTLSNAITVFPFDIKSANTDIQYLGEGIVDLISTKLEGIPTLIPIDPNRIFNQLKKEKETIPALEKATEISNTLGAAEFILGSIIELNDELQISASKYDSEGDLIAKESIEGQKSALANLINELTKALIADKLKQEGQELNSLAVMTSDNLPALKAYLEGEQAYRKADFRDAFDFFKTAVDLDSTFALAWLRLNDADAWVGLGVDEKSLKKARQYGEKLPPKWKDLLKVQEVFNTGLASNEDLIANMHRKYGENPQFTNLMAEHLFHYNPFHGRSITEAKPWLEKTWNLDPGNQEAFRHLIQIAFVEGDKLALMKFIDELSSESRLRPMAQLYLMAWQDSVTENELKEFAAALPRMQAGSFWPRQQVPEDPTRLLELGQRFIPYLENDRRNYLVPLALSILGGQDKETIALMKKRDQESPPDDKQKFERLVSVAHIIANRDFLLYEDLYQGALDSLADHDQPRAFFASAKYAWVLQNEALYNSNKQKLLAASQQSQEVINPARYYYWTLAAFEARQNKDNDKALIFIDSVFQYTPASGYFGEASAAVMDKAFMLADIYEEQGEFEKAIQRLEHLPMFSLYMETKGYATYRLTQLYEKSGNVNKALEKCDLFLKNYKDCDEKYRPWWNEIEERRKRIMTQVN